MIDLDPEKPQERARRPTRSPLDVLDLDWSETSIPEKPQAAAMALRLLARWLLSTARKGAPVADSAEVEGSQNRLDVGPGAKVGSDER